MALNPRLTDWSGKIVWLVGASTGIGRATAVALHARGALVIVSARTGSTLEAFVQAHPGSTAIALDATDSTALHDAAQRIVAQHGRIDLVAYCAGTYRAMRADRLDLTVALRHVDVNYVGALRLLDAVLPHLLRQAKSGKGAHISLVASVAGYRGLPNALAYGPTKAALINLAEVLYLDLAREGIGVSVVNPGFVETPLTAGNQFAMPALMSPEQAAECMVEGWGRGRFEIHFPKRFTLWLKVLRHLGSGVYFAAIRRATGL
jgi:NAD(P)-dependent dehydrogenase (short-subunit alcohol dehydrogenase family)